MGVDESCQLGLGGSAHFVASQFAVLEQQQGGNATNAELGGDAAVLVHIDLHDGELALVFAGHLVERGRDHAARPAPLGPEVHENGNAGLQHVLLEIGVIGVFDQFASHGHLDRKI